MGEKIYVVGVQFMNFKGNDGHQVDGVKVHYTQQVSRTGLTGDIAGNFFISRQYWDSLPIITTVRKGLHDRGYEEQEHH